MRLHDDVSYVMFTWNIYYMWRQAWRSGIVRVTANSLCSCCFRDWFVSNIQIKLPKSVLLPTFCKTTNSFLQKHITTILQFYDKCPNQNQVYFYLQVKQSCKNCVNDVDISTVISRFSQNTSEIPQGYMALYDHCMHNI